MFRIGCWKRVPSSTAGTGIPPTCSSRATTSTRSKRWVRNVDRTPWSYWLPTSTDRFYPDFIAELTDGRILVVEYKGQDRTDNADSREKRNIGRRLEEVSEGKVLFWWAEDAPSGNLSRELTAIAS